MYARYCRHQAPGSFSEPGPAALNPCPCSSRWPPCDARSPPPAPSAAVLPAAPCASPLQRAAAPTSSLCHGTPAQPRKSMAVRTDADCEAAWEHYESTRGTHQPASLLLTSVGPPRQALHLEHCRRQECGSLGCLLACLCLQRGQTSPGRSPAPAAHNTGEQRQ